MLELDGKWISSCSLWSFFGLFAGGADGSGTTRSFPSPFKADGFPLRESIPFFRLFKRRLMPAGYLSPLVIRFKFVASSYHIKGPALCRWTQNKVHLPVQCLRAAEKLTGPQTCDVMLTKQADRQGGSALASSLACAPQSTRYTDPFAPRQKMSKGGCKCAFLVTLDARSHHEVHAPLNLWMVLLGYADWIFYLFCSPIFGSFQARSGFHATGSPTWEKGA